MPKSLPFDSRLILSVASELLESGHSEAGGAGPPDGVVRHDRSVPQLRLTEFETPQSLLASVGCELAR